MKPRLSAYAVLFVVGLILAYFASVESDKTQSDGQIWLNEDPKKFVSARYVEKEGTEPLTLVKRDTGTYWITKKSAEKEVSESFKVKESIKNDFINPWSELRAIKVLGEAKDLNLSDYGLENSYPALELNFGDKTAKFLIGKSSFQSPNIFVLDEQKKTVLLVSRRLISVLDRPENSLFERTIHNLSFEKITKIEAISDEKTITFNPEKQQSEKLLWKRDGKVDEALGSWMSKFLDLKIKVYHSGDDVSPFESLPIKLTIKFYENESIIEEISIRQQSNNPNDSNPADYILKSSFTEGFVSIYSSRVETILQDFKNVL